MNTIFELCKNTIELGNFDLNSKLRELTSIMLVGQIDPFEYDELTRLAQQYANAEVEPADTNILGALRTVNEELASIKARLARLEEAHNEAPVQDEYPAWERWNGQSDSGYPFGAKVSHLGAKYISNYVGLNVWEPGLQGTEALWTKVE